MHNAADSAKPLFAEAQNALLVQLQAAGIPVPAPLPLAEGQPCKSHASCSRGGDPCTLRIAAEDGRQHAVRALSWLPGKLLVDVLQVRRPGRAPMPRCGVHGVGACQGARQC